MDNAKVGDLTVSVLKSIIKESNDDLRAMLTTVSEDVAVLKSEQQSLKNEIVDLKTEREVDRQKIQQLEDFIKKRNLVFRGVSSAGTPKESVQQICEQQLKLQGKVEVVSTRKLGERDGKRMIVAEFRTEEMVSAVLQNVRKLSGSSISIEQDINSSRQLQKRLMLKLKRNILTVTKSHRVSVRNEKLKIGDNWFYWSKDNKLMFNKSDAKETLKTVFGSDFDKINFDYFFLLNSFNAKN